MRAMNVLSTKQIVAVLSGFILIFLAPFFVRSVLRQRAIQKPTFAESYVGSKFQRVQLIRNKVLLIPAPPIKGVDAPQEIYLLSKQAKGYWRKPMTVGVGFEFGFFDGAKSYRYKIVNWRADGVMLQYDYDGAPPRPDNQPYEIIKLRWK
jgi:hypothetical protein